MLFSGGNGGKISTNVGSVILSIIWFGFSVVEEISSCEFIVGGGDFTERLDFGLLQSFLFQWLD
jgi:hypothetical protein